MGFSPPHPTRMVYEVSRHSSDAVAGEREARTAHDSSGTGDGIGQRAELPACERKYRGCPRIGGVLGGRAAPASGRRAVAGASGG